MKPLQLCFGPIQSAAGKLKSYNSEEVGMDFTGRDLRHYLDKEFIPKPEILSRSIMKLFKKCKFLGLWGFCFIMSRAQGSLF